MLQLLNLLAFLAVAGYAIICLSILSILDIYLLKLGKKVRFEPNLKERLNTVLSMFLVKKNCLKIRKVDLCTYSFLWFFYHTNWTYRTYY